jgi:acetylornithine deacetylase
VDPLSLADVTRALVDIDSTTGREGEAGEWLAAYLRGRGYAVERQPVTDGRFNLVAVAGRPEVVFSTHYDCVPPFFPSRVEGDVLWGRGACDAKGILAAQIAACDRLRANGELRVGLLFVVGEERGSDGAHVANRHPIGSRYLVGGEPTDNRLAAATRGMWRVRLRTAGRAAHSSMPELGESAIEKLVTALTLLRELPLPADGLMGPTTYSVGLIEGGVAPNVIPPSASAEVMFRTVGPAEEVRRALRPLETLASLEDILEVPPVRMHVPAGSDAVTFAYTTDLPFLGAWGRPLLLGPGSIRVAHTDHEHVRLPDLEHAVDRYVSLAEQLLGAAAS